MFGLSEQSRAAWARYQAGQGRFQIRYMVTAPYRRVGQTSSSNSYALPFAISGLHLKERGISHASTTLPDWQCTFYSRFPLVEMADTNGMSYSIGDFFIEAWLAEWSDSNQNWVNYVFSRTPWFSVVNQERVYNEQEQYKITGSLRAFCNDEKMFFSTQAPISFDTSEFRASTPRIYSHTILFLEERGKTFTTGSEKGTSVASLLAHNAEEEYDYSGNALQILFNHFRNRGMYLRFEYMPFYHTVVSTSSPYYEQWKEMLAQYDKDFDFSAKTITRVGSAGTADISISFPDDVYSFDIDDKPFWYRLSAYRVYSVNRGQVVNLLMCFSPAIDVGLSQGYSPEDKVVKTYVVNTPQDKTTLASLPQNAQPLNPAYTGDYFAIGKIWRNNFSSVTLSDVYVPYSGNSRSFVLFPTTDTTYAQLSGLGANGYMVNISPITGDIQVKNSKSQFADCIEVNTHTNIFDLVSSGVSTTDNFQYAKNTFSILANRQYTLTMTTHIIPQIELYDTVLIGQKSGTNFYGQVVQKTTSQDSGTMELVLECEQDPSVFIS